jgi:hypothetical protein
VIYVRSEGEGAVLGGSTPQVMVQRRDAWYEPQGLWLLRVKDLESGEILAGGSLEASDSHGTVVDLVHPTPAWLAGLPSDPDELAAVLIQQSETYAQERPQFCPELGIDGTQAGADAEGMVTLVTSPSRRLHSATSPASAQLSGLALTWHPARAAGEPR